MDYVSAPINESPVMAVKAGTDLTDIRGKAVKYDENGNVMQAAAGDTAIGIATLSNEELIPAGNSVEVQLLARGFAKTGAAVKCGDFLSPDAEGALIPATSGPYVAVALQEATAAGEFVEVRLAIGK